MNETFYLTTDRPPRGFEDLTDVTAEKVDYSLRFCYYPGKFRRFISKPRNVAFVVFAREVSNGYVFYFRSLKRNDLVRVLLRGRRLLAELVDDSDLDLDLRFASIIGPAFVIDPVQRALVLYSHLQDLRKILGASIFDFGRLDFSNLFAEAVVFAHERTALVGLCHRDGRYLVFRKTSER